MNREQIQTSVENEQEEYSLKEEKLLYKTLGRLLIALAIFFTGYFCGIMS